MKQLYQPKTNKPESANACLKGKHLFRKNTWNPHPLDTSVAQGRLENWTHPQVNDIYKPTKISLNPLQKNTAEYVQCMNLSIPIHLPQLK